jgi:serine/threonine protein phosphatase PrpC
MYTECIDLWKIVSDDGGEVDESIQLSFFGMYDGHAGKDCAIMVSKRICKVLVRTEAFKARDWEKAMIQAYEVDLLLSFSFIHHLVPTIF